MAFLVEEAEKTRVGQLATGALAGAIGFGLICIPKAIVDVVGWITGQSNTAELIKGVVDLGIGAATLIDVSTKPKDEFWKGAEWAFGILETVFGSFALATAVTNMVMKTSLESPTLRLEKGLIKLLTGREY
jgi:hypothetical protein